MAVMLGDEVGASCLIKRILSSNLNTEQCGKMAEEEDCSERALLHLLPP